MNSLTKIKKIYDIIYKYIIQFYNIILIIYKYKYILKYLYPIYIFKYL